ncbi:hypothetical protein PC110_g9816 [Phytophthora cactorum]|uniref:Uncharacterized protein n=1 Tax=Phytophthora cactorum TaxID=29920 RepID=A0A329SAL7_9STRA|nr:hypothetical protein PC110_g9816 [Phytophthora cactorum]
MYLDAPPPFRLELQRAPGLAVSSCAFERVNTAMTIAARGKGGGAESAADNSFSCGFLPEDATFTNGSGFINLSEILDTLLQMGEFIFLLDVPGLFQKPFSTSDSR